jgi:glucan biosynthesis protein
MYQTGENDRRMATDWRPEIHDSDGLSMQSGKGEWIWRPLTNPVKLSFNSFADRDPKGFGLLQRDRNFEHYQDDGVFYDKRPSLWVEPKSGWGDGAVQLVQIPTVDETVDNVVAFWNPAQKLQPGQEALFGYRLWWGSKPPVEPTLATCVATRTGVGGIVGKKREHYAWRFAVDAGEPGLENSQGGTRHHAEQRPRRDHFGPAVGIGERRTRHVRRSARCGARSDHVASVSSGGRAEPERNMAVRMGAACAGRAQDLAPLARQQAQ